MQGLTQSPRDAFAAAEIRSLITGDSLEVSAGLELLDSSNNFVEDISDDLDGGEISRSNFADVHGTCKLEIVRELAWGKDRVRPYMTLANDLISARFNLGVFVLTTPETSRIDNVITYEAQGFDLLYLLQSGPSDTYVATSGTTYLTAVQDVLTASGVGVGLQLDGTGSATTLPVTMVWALNPDAETSWLSIINDLLSAINYRGLWANENGVFTSSPYAAPSTRAIEWTFDTSISTANIVGQERTLTSDVWAAKNWWRFVRKAMTVKPIEGAGIYTVTNASTGRTSVAALGRTVKAPVQFLDAADQTSLVAQGDKIVAKNQAISRSFTIEVDPLPIASHFDIVELIDAGFTDKCQVTSWTLPLDGSQGRWNLESVEA